MPKVILQRRHFLPATHTDSGAQDRISYSVPWSLWMSWVPHQHARRRPQLRPSLSYQKLGVDWKRADLTLSLGSFPGTGADFVCGYLLSQAWEDAKMN